MKTERVSDNSVERIKKRAKYNLAKTFESNNRRVDAFEAKLDYGETPESFLDGYNRVTPDKVMEVANKYLPDRETGKYVLYIRDPSKN